jgi:hypothetical protein
MILIRAKIRQNPVEELDEWCLNICQYSIDLYPMNLTSSKQDLSGLPVSINDIRDKYFEDIPLSQDEELALKNFDKYRMDYLNSAPNEEVFEKRYLELQAKANLASFTEFLDLSSLKSLE